MSKLEAILPVLYKDMHAKNMFLGDTWRRHADRFQHFIAHTKNGTPEPILDFGCGPQGGIANAYNRPGQVISYDPYIKQYSQSPWEREPRTFFSCDVFEHMTLGQLRDVLQKICKQKLLYRVFISLSTRAANKVMPNGMNAHITIRFPDWWMGFFEYSFGEQFECVISEYDMHRAECTFAFTRIPQEAPCESAPSPPSLPAAPETST